MAQGAVTWWQREKTSKAAQASDQENSVLWSPDDNLPAFVPMAR